MNRRWLLIVSCPLLIACAGCDDGMVRVNGKVTFDDQPLEHGVITFVSVGSRAASGEIEHGVIKRVTTKTTDDGLAPGVYRVAIRALDRSEEHRNAMAAPSIIPTKYADIATSGLTATIEAGQSAELRFDLQ